MIIAVKGIVAVLLTILAQTLADDWIQIGSDIYGKAADDKSGSEIAFNADGTILAIASLGNDDGGSSAGQVRVFEYNGSSWNQLGADLNGEAANDYFGSATALSDDGSIVAIGAMNNDNGGSDAGQVKVYQYNGIAWVQLGGDVIGEAISDKSGSSVALSSDGTILAVGAPRNNGGGSDSGHVRVYEYIGAAWVQLGADIDGEAAADNSGVSVALSSDGTILAIGADYNDGGAADAGHVRVYEYSGGTWNQLGSDIDGGVADDRSGFAIGLNDDGSILVVGEPNNDDVGNNAGRVRVYQYSLGTWSLLGSPILAEAAGDVFGRSVSINSAGDIVAVGAFANDGTAGNAGHVRVYEFVAGAWSQLGPDIDGQANGDNFGYAVRLSSDGLLVAAGARDNDDGANSAGNVRVFSYQDTPTSIPTSIPTTVPTSIPSSLPTAIPTSIPTTVPTSIPSSVPTAIPTSNPSISAAPTSLPTSVPTSVPSSIPTSAPSYSQAPTLVTQIAEGRGSVTMDLVDACEAVELTISLNFTHRIFDRQHIFVSLSGFTTGACTYPSSGADIENMVFYNTSEDMSSSFEINYVEGSWKNMYAESEIRIISNQDLQPDTEYRIVLDRSNGIKLSCSRSASGDLPLEFKERGSQARFAAGNLTLLPVVPPTLCYVYSSSLALFPPMPDMYTRVTLRFTLSRDITAFSNVTLHLPGFSIAGVYSTSATSHNKWMYGEPRSASLVIEPADASQFWAGYWVDGSYDDAAGPYASTKAYLTLASADDVIRSGTDITLVFPTLNKIAISCGRNINYDGFKLSMNDITGINNITAATLSLATQIGRGCPGANDDGYECNGRGVCNHCSQKCECFDGYGSASDKSRVEYDTFASDCSSKICPFGPSFGKLTTGGGTNNTVNTGAHALAECSSRGICDRKYGTCTCLRGFTGAACQRRACLGAPECSGRGECRTMKQLASTAEHYPLSTNTDTSRYNYVPVLDGVTWDGESNMGCVCDSSWVVGLGAGETQQSEYFGPSCEFRRCPSGDDPTTAPDETDCSFRSTRAYPGGPYNGIGEAGNKCHHDCSGRGSCDYRSGVCTCYAGVTGANCGTLITSKDYTEIKGNDTIPLVGIGVPE